MRESERGGRSTSLEVEGVGETVRGAGGGARFGGVGPTRRGRGGGESPLAAETVGEEKDLDARWRAGLDGLSLVLPTLFPLCPLPLLPCRFPPNASNTSLAAPTPQWPPPLAALVARGLRISCSPDSSSPPISAVLRMLMRLSLALAACPKRDERRGEVGGE